MLMYTAKIYPAHRLDLRYRIILRSFGTSCKTLVPVISDGLYVIHSGEYDSAKMRGFKGLCLPYNSKNPDFVLTTEESNNVTKYMRNEHIVFERDNDTYYEHNSHSYINGVKTCKE